VKTTLEIPDDLFRQTEAAAAVRGESLKDFVTEALQAHLERQTIGVLPRLGWRSVFGQARREEVEPIDALIDKEIESIEPADSRERHLDRRSGAAIPPASRQPRRPL